MSNLDDNIAFMLDNHALEQYPWSVWVIPDKTTNEKIQIIDSNGNNPKVSLLSFRQQQAFLGITDTLPSYEVIVIKEDQNIDLVKAQYQWFISFDGDETFVKYYADVKQSPQPNLYWQVILTKVN